MATVFDQHFAAWGVTQAQFRLMLAIHEEGGDAGISPSALAGHLLLERATISVLTQKMVERGLLSRLPGENRRTFQLTLSDNGRALLFALIPRAVALADDSLSGIALTQLQEMQRMLGTVENHLRKVE